MRAVISKLLWIGNSFDVANVKAAIDSGVAAVVHVAVEDPPQLYPRETIYLRLPLIDGPDNQKFALRAAIRAVADLISAEVPTLVACSNGMSRSPAIVAAAISCVKASTPDEVLREIAKVTPLDVSPALWTEVRSLLAQRSSGRADECA